MRIDESVTKEARGGRRGGRIGGEPRRNRSLAKVIVRSTASSPTSARTSRTSSGSSAFLGAISTTACSASKRMVASSGPRRQDREIERAVVWTRPRIYNVIDSRQMLQALLSQALRTFGHVRKPSARSIFPTRWWRSHATARELSARRLRPRMERSHLSKCRAGRGSA